MRDDSLQPAEAVLRFLASVGPSADAELYLRLFRSRPPESFGTIVVEADALEGDASSVAVDLRFLRALDLTPVVVLGLHAPESAGAHRLALRKRLDDATVATELLDTDDPARVAEAARRGVIPLLFAAGSDPTDRLERLGRMLSALHTHKLIFLGARGGLRLRGERISVANLTTDHVSLLASSDLAPEQRRALEDSHRLAFELVSHPLLFAITSPLDLLRELFTVKGAGTLLRRGARIVRHEGYASLDLGRLRELLEASFGRTIEPAFFARPIRNAYVEEGYRGAALVTEGPRAGYLSKFAVTREAQGEGIGQDLWGALIADYAALVWRARRDNPIRAWYERNCQGRFEAGDFTVYFRGLAADDVPQAVHFALAQPIDL